MTSQPIANPLIQLYNVSVKSLCSGHSKGGISLLNISATLIFVRNGSR